MIDVQAEKDFGKGFQLLIDYKPVNVLRSLKDIFYSRFQSHLAEVNIFFFSASITPFKKHYRFKRNK